MTATAGKDWKLEPVREPFTKNGREGWRVNTHIWSALHLPTGNKVVLVFDEHGYIERAQAEECPHELMNEAMEIFGDYLKNSACSV